MNVELFDGYPESVRKRFKDFHSNNPHVFQEFRKLAFQMKETGRKKYSARTIIEVMRWNFNLNTGGDVFKVNDDYVPIYARLMIYHHPEFAEFFELRKVRSKGHKSAEQIAREREQCQ